MPGNPARVADLTALARVWRGLGLTVLEMPGWQDRGRESGNTFEVLGVHHTAAASDIDRVLRDGRPDLPGPLCNVALHANGDVVLVASGKANHFGAATWPSTRALGVEATGPPFTGNYDAYVRLAAGFALWRGDGAAQVVRGDVPVPVHAVAAHREVATPYDRKPDPGFGTGRTLAGVTLMDSFRDEVAAVMAAATQEWWQVPIPDAELAKIRKVAAEEAVKALDPVKSQVARLIQIVAWGEDDTAQGDDPAKANAFLGFTGLGRMLTAQDKRIAGLEATLARGVAVDPATVTEAVRAAVAAHPIATDLNDDDVAALAQGVADEVGRRIADRTA